MDCFPLPRSSAKLQTNNYSLHFEKTIAMNQSQGAYCDSRRKADK